MDKKDNLVYECFAVLAMAVDRAVDAYRGGSELVLRCAMLDLHAAHQRTRYEAQKAECEADEAARMEKE